jgi:hypothetical protein
LVAVRDSLESLQLARETYEPPEGLAARTCRYLAMFAPPAAHPAARSPAHERRALRRARRMTAAFAPPSSRPSWSWADLSVATAIMVLLSWLVFPAVQNSRVHARMMACQNNLRDIGVNLVQRQESHPGLAFRGPEPGAPVNLQPSTPLVYCALGAGQDAIGAGRDAIGEGLPTPSDMVARSADRPQQIIGANLPTPPVRVTDNIDLFPEVSSSWLSAPRPGHHGISDSARGQNVLYGDGRVTFVSTGWDRPSDDGWLLDQNPAPPAPTLTLLRP